MSCGTNRIAVQRLSRSNLSEFARIHDGAHSLCQCVAWWVPTWDGWAQRTQQQNSDLRAQLFADHVFDGYLIYRDDVLAGWCQAWKRDAFAKIATQFGTAPDNRAWMIGCLLTLPDFRNQGVAKTALRSIMPDLKARGALTVDAYPKRGACDEGELWNGPESTYLELGFEIVRDDAKRPVLRLSF
jgi:GNAT superfamily N-acetyltransferase